MNPRHLPLALAAATIAVLVAGAALTGGSAEPARAVDTTHLAHPGPYAVELREVQVPGPPVVPVLLYLPVGPEQPVPAVGFGHGFLAHPALYASTLATLASHGNVVVAPVTQLGPIASPTALAADLDRALRWTAEGGAGPTVDTSRLVLAGHSMGGAAALLAATTAGSPATSVVTLAAANVGRATLDAASELTIPALFVAAELDTTTPVDRHQRPLAQAAGAEATFEVIAGATHCGFVDPVPGLALVCGAGRTPHAQQLARAQELLVRWVGEPELR